MEILEKIKTSKALLAYFSTPECQVCKTLRPKVEALIGSKPQIEFLYINTHETREASGQYLVFAVPTIILFIEGREIKRFSRHLSMGELEDFIDRIF